MKKFLLWTAVVLGLATIIHFAEVSEDQHPRPPLDYSKPVFTTDNAIVCPIGILFDQRADHGPSAVFDMFVSIANRSSKVRALGCQEWQGGIQVRGVGSGGGGGSGDGSAALGVGLFQVALGFGLAASRVVVGLLGFAVFVDGALALRQHVKNLSKIDVAPAFGPLFRWLRNSLQGFA